MSARPTLRVLGCSGSYPGPESPASSYVLEAPFDDGTGERTWRVVVDLGSGALSNLQRWSDPLGVDAVLISHLHADHCLDLCGYYVMRKYHPTGQQPMIPVWGPEDTAGRMARAYDLPEEPGMSEEFDFLDWADAPAEGVRVGPFTVHTRAVDHPVLAYGMRIEVDGAVLAYTGDTGPCPQLTELARDADVLLAEASFREGDVNPPNLHLTAAECGTLATEAGVQHLVLTHIPPWYEKAPQVDEARSTFGGGRISLAEPGMLVEL
ncbi:MBL fold metallo-hydrolase [Nocardioides bruguierae]|uniref:MBL fold metallo-hydrolase n=1 Tax=Nocardioides bruguierae TaxID=2945102 RepID=A0A9X2D6V5_9ACTN|nr:MBL fold metallo-hydrolase [Nocardioides bruguierae]MCM0620457.1 MBL fold metallo-hydrolase [Nocardioides bruguierae]